MKINNVTTSLVPKKKPRYNATNYRTELIKTLDILNRLTPNVNTSRLPVTKPTELTKKKKYNLKINLTQTLPTLTQNQNYLKK